MEARHRRRPREAWLPVAWVAFLSLLMTAPTLAPGFVLSYDLVFTPRQDLLPGSLGIGGALPRAVPQDALVAVVETVLPGSVLEKVVLLAIPVVTGLGVLRLLRGQSASARIVAGTLAIWNPFVAERLVLGHWGLLLAYALVPWALASALDVRRGVPGAGTRLVLQVAAAGLTPSGSLLVALLAVPVALLPGSRAGVGRRAAIAAASVATWVPWLMPALLHPSALANDPLGVRVFALRDEGWGIVVSILGLGGVWNAEVVPASRGWVSAPVLALVIVAFAAYGTRPLVSALGRVTAAWWATCALVGALAALASALLPGPWSSLLAALPGGGLLRDAHKLLAPLALLLAVGAGFGVARLAARSADRATRLTAVAAAVLIPIALLPDLAWGVGGRLAPVDYPPEWAAAREVLLVDSRPGDVAVLPWSAFRRFTWNADRTVLDPAPRWLPRTSVGSDGLAVRTPDGVVVVAGEDPRGRAVESALQSGNPIAPELARLGIGWVLVELGQQPAVSPSSLTGLEQVPLLSGWPGRADSGLALYAVPGPIAASSSPPGAALIVAADLIVLGLLAGIAAVAAAGAWRRRPS